jgi:hypothetical protein
MKVIIEIQTVGKYPEARNMLNTTPEGDLEAFADYGGPSKSCPPAAAIVKRSWTSLPRPETTSAPRPPSSKMKLARVSSLPGTS